MEQDEGAVCMCLRVRVQEGGAKREGGREGVCLCVCVCVCVCLSVCVREKGGERDRQRERVRERERERERVLVHMCACGARVVGVTYEGVVGDFCCLYVKESIVFLPSRASRCCSRHRHCFCCRYVLQW
jgi:hypothetical protein